MNRIRYWLSSKKLQMAQLKDLSRQLQEAWAECDTLGDHLVDSWDYAGDLLVQLHRVARERDNERKQKQIAQTANADLLEALENLSGAVHAVGYDTVSIIHPALLNANEAIRKHTKENDNG